MDVADIQMDREQVNDQLGDRAQKLFQEFLETFGNENGVGGKYADDARNLSKPERNTLSVSYADIEEFNQDLATTITQDYYRIYPYLCRALMNFVRDTVDTSAVGNGSSLLKKQFYVSLTDVPLRLNVRELTTDRVGVLLKISGQVVRTHPVHPELISGVFECLDCETVIKGVEQQFKYTQPSTCTNMACQNRTRFKLNTYASKFVDFQKIRVQETQSELPRGSIPRSMEVVVRAEAVELPQAGDKCDFIGTLIVVPDVGTLNLPGAKAESGGRNRGEGSDNVEGIQGLKACGVRELHYRLAFLASSVTPTNPRLGGGEWEIEDVTLASMNKQMSQTEWEHLFKMMTDKRLYLNLINSLFPTIHGNEEVKRGVLLQLFGGVAKTTEEGTSLRGDINVCIVGDPSTAKSQFLKQVSDFSPRAVYTSGKASTAAGLTAAVVKDEESYEFVIEAGALMLADNGVCCIDEFDKMEVKDQVAIHEAMEQQTISITKASIKATLNARTSILAAANPKGGQYDRTKSLRQNIDMSAAIMSRFDLFFVVVDEPNEVADYAIAQKIVNLHAHHEETLNCEYTREEVLRYILFARQFKPQIGKTAASALVKYYKYLRLREGGANPRGAWKITVRQLESLIRLSEAHCRLECKDTVEERHVNEAYRLLNKSIIRVSQPEVDLDQDLAEDQLRPGIQDDDEDLSIKTHLSCPPSPGIEGLEDPETQVEGEGPSGSCIPNSPPSTVGSALPKRTTLSYDEFKSMADLILMYMRKQEGLVEIPPEDEHGDRETRTEELRRSQIINWYLDEVSDEIEDTDQLIQKKAVVEKVIQRLIDHDNVIISIVKTGIGKSAVYIESDPILVVHPNYNVDDGIQPYSPPPSRRRRH